MEQNKVVTCSCGHREAIDVVLTPGNEYAWTKLWEATPCKACMWVEIPECDITDVDVRMLANL